VPMSRRDFHGALMRKSDNVDMLSVKQCFTAAPPLACLASVSSFDLSCVLLVVLVRRSLRIVATAAIDVLGNSPLPPRLLRPFFLYACRSSRVPAYARMESEREGARGGGGGASILISSSAAATVIISTIVAHPIVAIIPTGIGTITAFISMPAHIMIAVAASSILVAMPS
jgi:hypothetical protein